MDTVFVVVMLVTVAANLFAATADWVPAQQVVDNGARLRIPTTWLPWLGAAKAAGAAGLLVGLAIPAIGIAAASGLILFFILAIGTHLRARDYALTWPAGFLTLSVATLLLGLAA